MAIRTWVSRLDCPRLELDKARNPSVRSAGDQSPRGRADGALIAELRKQNRAPTKVKAYGAFETCDGESYGLVMPARRCLDERRASGRAWPRAAARGMFASVAWDRPGADAAVEERCSRGRAPSWERLSCEVVQMGRHRDMNALAGPRTLRRSSGSPMFSS